MSNTPTSGFVVKQNKREDQSTPWGMYLVAVAVVCAVLGAAYLALSPRNTKPSMNIATLVGKQDGAQAIESVLQEQNRGLFIKEAKYFLAPTQYSTTVAVEIEFQNSSSSVMETVFVHCRIRRSGRPLPDHEILLSDKIKGGLNPREDFSHAFSTGLSELKSAGVFADSNQYIVEVSTDKETWVQASKKAWKNTLE